MKAKNGAGGLLNSPWPWLAYLPFYCLPWFWQFPSNRQLIASLLGTAAFLPLYLLGYRLKGWQLAAASAAVLALGLALSRSGGSWTVFSVYAAAMIGTLRPPRPAVAAIWSCAVVTATAGLLLRQPAIWWLPGAMFVIMTGLSTVARESLYERNTALLSAQDEVRTLSRTAERERIARDLHDLIGRTLTLVALKADVARRMVTADPTLAAAEMGGVADLAREGLAEVRFSLAGMAGGSLRLEAEASRRALEAAGIEASLAGDVDAVAPEAGAILAMTLREAVTNVIRHSSARRCSVTIGTTDQSAHLAVVDDGRGSGLEEGNGLAGMRKRLAAAGGTLHRGCANPGTRVEATVPA